MAIEKTLVLSTAHISAETNTILTRFPERCPWRCQYHEYGFILFGTTEEAYVPNPADLDELGMGELYAIFRYAFDNRCVFVYFDRDADKLDEFPTFDW